jgi:hypothetical protein
MLQVDLSSNGTIFFCRNVRFHQSTFCQFSCQSFLDVSQSTSNGISSSRDDFILYPQNLEPLLSHCAVIVRHNLEIIGHVKAAQSNGFYLPITCSKGPPWVPLEKTPPSNTDIISIYPLA